ncbi:MAG: pentapeptide repeat-containing protein [Synechocystis sp.]
MVDSSQVQELLSQYQAGDRRFHNLQLRRLDLHGLNFSGADFSGSDFTEANLRDMDLSGCNLSGAYFNDADLSGANLQKAQMQGASLIKTYLLKVNLQEAALDNALCTGAFLTRADLSGACLNGTLFNGANLTGAKLNNAKYNKKTRFDTTFNLEKAGLKKVATDASPAKPVSPGITTAAVATTPTEISLPTSLTVEDLLLMFDHLGDLGNHYLGSTMASRYLISSRPALEWFEQFEVDKKTVKLKYNGSQKDAMTPAQIELAQEWAKKYIKSCAMIFKTFPTMIEADQCVFSVV